MAKHCEGPAELVVTGANVRTLDAEGTRCTALAVRGGRILAAGGGDEVSGFAGTGTRVLDFAGRTVIPGINDSHLHAAWLGALWPSTIMDSSTYPPAGRLVEGPEQRRAAILRAGELCASLGITSYTEPGLGPGENDGETGCFTDDVLADYAELAAEGKLRTRVTALRLFGILDGPSEIDEFERGLDSALPDSDPEWLNVAGVKIFADGIPPMRTAWTRHRYPDGTSGRLLVAGANDRQRQRNMARMVELAHARGLQVGVHATGDRSIEAVLDAVAAATDRHGPAERHYVIHGDLVSPAQLARMAQLGIGLAVQPGIAVATAERVADALGEQVARAAWPLEEMLAAALTLTLNSDAPILAPDWRAQLAAATELLSQDGPGEAVMERLLRCYTTEPARQDGAETWKGSLEPGKVADFCVLSADPVTADAAALRDIDVEATYVGGRPVFER